MAQWQRACLPMQEMWVQSLGWGRSPREGNGHPLWYPCLENLIDRGVWWAIDHGVTKELDMTSQLNHNNNAFTY